MPPTFAFPASTNLTQNLSYRHAQVCLLGESRSCPVGSHYESSQAFFPMQSTIRKREVYPDGRDELQQKVRW